MTAKWLLSRWGMFILVMLALWGAFFWMLGPVDDAYITARYAENLAAGHGIVFNHGEKVEGCTAFGMMVLLAAFAKLGISNLIIPAQALGVISWALVCAFVLLLIKRKQMGGFGFFDAFGLAFVVSVLSALAWSWSGMETPMVAMFWIAAVVSHLRENESGKWPIFSAVFTIAAGLMRPDGIIIAIPIGLSLLFPLNKERLYKTFAFSSLVLVIFGAYWVWRWGYFGYPLPNTFYAKVSGGSFMRMLVMGFLFYVLKGMIALVVPLIVLVQSRKLLFKFRAIPREAWVYAAVCGTSLAYMLYVGGDFFPFQRFFVPVIPFWALLMVELSRIRKVDPVQPDSDDEPKKAKHKKRLTPTQAWIFAIGAMVAVNIVCASVHTQLAKHIYLVELTEEWSETGRELKEQLPKKAVIAAIPIGALGYWSDRYVLDMLGLIDIHIAHKQLPPGRGVRGHEKFDTEYVLARRPELILTWPMFVQPIFNDVLDWRLNHKLSPAQRSILDTLHNEKSYTPLALPMNEDFYVITLVRNDLVKVAPYKNWKPIEGHAAGTILADSGALRNIIGFVKSKKIKGVYLKGDWQRATEHLYPQVSKEKRVF